MRKTDSVFLLTLIDFLFQIIFFGIFIYAVYMTSQLASESKRDEDIKRLQRHFGIGDLTVLTDELTRLAPIEKIQKVFNYIDANGGQARFDEAMKKLEEGAGKPHCLYSSSNKQNALELAEVTATDNRIVFMKETKELKELLGRMHLKYSDVKDLSLLEFKTKFRSVLDIDPNCRYTLRFHEKTNYVYARSQAEQIFYLRKMRDRK